MPHYIVKLKNQEQYHDCCTRLKTEQKSFKSFTRLNAIRVTLDENQRIEDFIDRDNIARIDEDITVYLIPDKHVQSSSSKLSKRPWGIEKIGAIYPFIPKKYSRPKVAVLDSGISVHPALKKNVKNINFSEEKSARDLDGHGTHIAGTISGFATKKDNKFHGTYPRLALYNVKAFSKDGTASLSNIIDAIDWCITHNIQVINMSFGIDHNHQSLYEAIQLAHENGVIMVAASGNDGNPGLKYPARYTEVISVGSTNQDDKVSSFSQFGANLDVVAPGEEIFSTWRKKKYKTISGTSMACAHATGVVSLILALRPDLRSADVRHILLQNTDRLSYPYLYQGNGLISVTKIVEQLNK